MKLRIFALISLLCLASSANATVLNFDDIAIIAPDTYTNMSGTNYGGLAWSTDSYVMDTSAFSGYGYGNGAVSGTNAFFNGYGNDVSISSAGGFDFSGAYFTSGIQNSLSVEAIGYSGGTALFDTTFTVNSSSPTWFSANFTGIDNLTFKSTSSTCTTSCQFTMDNFTFNSSVPEPAPLALLGIGLVGMGVNRKRKKKTQVK